MSAKPAEKSNGNSYEVLLNIKHDGKPYVPGEKITLKNKSEAEPLILSGAIGSSGSYKKKLAESEVVAMGDPKEIKGLVDELRAEIQDLKNMNKALREQLAKK